MDICHLRIETGCPTVDTMSHAVEWTLGWRIAKARRDAHLLQAELAEKVGVDRTLVSKWERDKRVPKLHELARVAVITNQDFIWLSEPYTGIIDLTDVPKPPSSCEQTTLLDDLRALAQVDETLMNEEHYGLLADVA